MTKTVLSSLCWEASVLLLHGFLLYEKNLPMALGQKLKQACYIFLDINTCGTTFLIWTSLAGVHTRSPRKVKVVCWLFTCTQEPNTFFFELMLQYYILDLNNMLIQRKNINCKGVLLDKAR